MGITNEQRINKLKNEIAKLEKIEKEKLKKLKKEETKKKEKEAIKLGLEVLKYEDQFYDNKEKIISLLQYFKTLDSEEKRAIMRVGREEMRERRRIRRAISRG
ncbi:hypothetical protein [Providencia manganoxydans]|uniref:hypothetical protein n=1 Tax=Providencia manganoxydans TaxID=2923283 RepID=UPI0032DAB944